MTNKFMFDSQSGLLRPVSLPPLGEPRRDRPSRGLRLVLVTLIAIVSSVFGVSVLRALTAGPPTNAATQ